MNGVDGKGEEKSGMFKESELPVGARVYGGSRFDWEYYQTRTRMQDESSEEEHSERDDWDGFGGDRGGYWMLPAVELRRENVETISSEDSKTEEALRQIQ